MNKRVLMVVAGLMLLAMASPVLAADAEATASSGDMWKYISAAFVLGVAAVAGAFGQSRAVVAACTSMGRNPGAAGAIRITMIVGVAFIESLVIYALLIAFMIL